MMSPRCTAVSFALSQVFLGIQDQEAGKDEAGANEATPQTNEKCIGALVLVFGKDWEFPDVRILAFALSAD